MKTKMDPKELFLFLKAAKYNRKLLILRRKGKGDTGRAYRYEQKHMEYYILLRKYQESQSQKNQNLE
jgi:hypothetical protein